MKSRSSIAEIMADGKLVDAALAAGAREAMRRHRMAGQPVAEWRDGKTVWTMPRESDASGAAPEEK